MVALVDAMSEATDRSISFIRSLEVHDPSSSNGHGLIFCHFPGLFFSVN
jgi:hypothetical protein